MGHDNSGIDMSKYRLGKLCQLGHEWEGSGQSLRHIKSRSCIDCRREQNRARFRKVAETCTEKFYLGRLCQNSHDHEATGKSLRYTKTRQCIRCMEEYRERDDYKESRKLHYEANKERIQARNKENYFKHREERNRKSMEYWRRTKDTPRQQMRMRRGKARRRAALADAHKSRYTSQDAIARMKEFDDSCCYCQKPLQLKTLCLDHFHPIFRGGPDVISNIVPTCRSCNSSKGALPPEQWYFAQPFANQKHWSRIVKALGLKGNVNQLPLF